MLRWMDARGAQIVAGSFEAEGPFERSLVLRRPAIMAAAPSGAVCHVAQQFDDRWPEIAKLNSVGPTELRTGMEVRVPLDIRHP